MGNRKIPRRVYFSDQKDYMKNAKDYFLYFICTKDKFNAYIYENKSNCCAGYFPDFILYPFVDRQVGIESTLTENENSYGITENIDLNLDYYPEFSDGKYTKQLSNIYSKYDNYYFYRMNSIYKICKKFWKPQEKSPSCRIVADSSRIGTKGEGISVHQSKYSQDHTPQPPGCRIVAKSSRIR